MAARNDLQTGRVVIELESGLEIAFRPQHVQGLEAATPVDLSEIEISPSGQGLHFPAIDADMCLPALLDGFLGSKAWMAARMGQVGGRATTQAKQAAVRANGWLGDGRVRRRLPDQVVGSPAAGRARSIQPFTQPACFLCGAKFLNQDKDLRTIRWGSPQDWSRKLGIVLSSSNIPSRA